MIKLYKLYNTLAGIILLFILLDRFSGKILKVVDSEFKRFLKLKENDKAYTYEEVIPILKTQESKNAVT